MLLIESDCMFCITSLRTFYFVSDSCRNMLYAFLEQSYNKSEMRRLRRLWNM